MNYVGIDIAKQTHYASIMNSDGEILVDRAGNDTELLHFLLFTDIGLDHPDAVDVFLNHIVQLIQHLEGPVENLEYPGCQNQQRNHQNGQSGKENKAQLDTDAHGGEHG